MRDLTITRRSDGGIEVLALAGEFSGSAVSEFERHVDQLVAEYRTRIVLDCAALHWIDSASLSCLIRTQTRLQPLGGEQVLAAPGALVTKTFKTLGMDRIFRTFPDVEQARRYLDG
ncbi:MAG: STAS domain-containing protein [Planctomycetota bacterium]|jgi:anti-anti-sigma factor